MSENNYKELMEEIHQLKKDKGAIILAHNYQLPEVQDVADFVGDSLQLARKAIDIKQETIVFCGVYFMAETAAILNPAKKVLLPDLGAGCPLADFATAEQVRAWRVKYPDHAFVTYINSNADVKAEVDICCTSSNAVKVVESVPQDKIVFLPDKNLGAFVAKKVNKEVVLWPGFCVVHETANLAGILESREKHPQALLMAHPECPESILEHADIICSTGQMFAAVKDHPDSKQFLVVTEWGMNHALSKAYPDREFIEPEVRMQCRNMKKITLPRILHVLKTGDNQVEVEAELAKRARLSIDRMLELK